MLQSIQLFHPLFFIHLHSLLTFSYVGLTAEREGETLARFVDESSIKRFSSLDLSRGKTRKVMEDNPIIVNKPFIPEDTIPEETMVGDKTPNKKEVKGQAYLTPLEVIVCITACFKRKRIFIPRKIGISTLFIDALMTTIHLPPPPILVVEATIIGPSTSKVLEDIKQRFKDAFSSLILSRAPFSFPTLIEDER